MELQPGFTRIIHPGLGPASVSVVAESSLPQYYRGGWRLLTDGDLPPEEPEDDPEPVTLADVAATATAQTVTTEEE